MIYISSVAFGKISLSDLINYVNRHKIPIELSANISYLKNIEAFLDKLIVPFLIHNYFPRPKDEFVLNLASSNNEIREKSVKFVCDNINRCEKYHIPIYTVHSGFRFDPRPKELGSTFNEINLINYDLAFELFIQSVKEILGKTKRSKVKLLFENNVITLDNLKVFGENPLLFCDVEDYRKLFHQVENERVGVLADYGHLKVSAHTLNFSIELFYKLLKDKIYAHHLSNNNELYDTNSFFTNIDEYNNIIGIENADYLILEIKNIKEDSILEQINMLKNFIERKM